MADSAYYVGGRYFDGANFKAVVAKFNADGTIDTSFGTSGKVSDVFGGTDDEILSIAVDTNGKIVVGGSVTESATLKDALARLNTDGSPDSGFGTSGITKSNFTSNTAITSLALLGDNTIIVGTNDDTIAKFDLSGSLDGTFASGGKLTRFFVIFGDGNGVGGSNLGLFGRVASVAIDPDGKIIAGGIYHGGEPGNGATFNGDKDAIGRVNSNGSRDTTFGIADSGMNKYGTTINNFGADRDASIDSVAVSDGGQIVASGHQRTFATGYLDAVASFDNTDGSLDWLTAGSYAGSGDEAYFCCFDNTGLILTSGQNGDTGVATIARFSTGGSLDASFGTAGLYEAFFGAANDIAYGLAVQPSGQIVAVGEKNNRASDAIGGLTPASTQDYLHVGTFGGGADVFFSVALATAATPETACICAEDSMLLEVNKAFVRIFPLGVTGKTVNIQLSKNGAALANPAAGPSQLDEIGGGLYSFPLDVDDVDTKGSLGYALIDDDTSDILGRSWDRVWEITEDIMTNPNPDNFLVDNTFGATYTQGGVIALNTDLTPLPNMTEPTAPPNMDDTLIDGLSWICHLCVTKRDETEDIQHIYNIAGDTVIAHSDQSDNGTVYVHSKYSG